MLHRTTNVLFLGVASLLCMLNLSCEDTTTQTTDLSSRQIADTRSRDVALDVVFEIGANDTESDGPVDPGLDDAQPTDQTPSEPADTNPQDTLEILSDSTGEPSDDPVADDQIDSAEDLTTEPDVVDVGSDVLDAVGEDLSSSLCGNEIVDEDEDCDDGDLEDDDGCDRDCNLTGTHEIFAQIRNIPGDTARLFLSLDQGGLLEPVVVVEPVVAGSTIVYIRIPVGPGGPFRLRALAVVAGWRPTVLSGGFTEGLVVESGGAVGAEIELEPATVELMPVTPSEVVVGRSFTVVAEFVDPAQAVSPSSGRWIYFDDESFVDFGGNRQTPTLLDSGGGTYSVTSDVLAENPNVAKTIHYQIAVTANGFNDEGEFPVFMYPSTRKGDILWEIAVLESPSGLDVTVTDVPVDADWVFVVVDVPGGSGQPVRIDGPPTASEATFSLGLEPGVGYRVRAIGSAGGLVVFPIVLSGGRAENLTVPESFLDGVSVALLPFGYVLEGETPVTIPFGTPYTIEMAISDPADFLHDVTSARVYASGSEFEYDMGGESSSGVLTQESPGSYRLSAVMPPVTSSDTIYFQFAESTFDFGRPGDVAPFLALPAIAGGNSLESLPVAPPAQGLDLTVTNVPAEAALLVAVADMGDLALRHEIIVEGTTVEADLGLPVGSFDQVRVVALTATPTVFPSVLAGQRQGSFEVEDSVFTAMSLSLETTSSTLTGAAPNPADPASLLTIDMRIGDPGHFLRSGNARLYGSMSTFENLSADQYSGTLTQFEPGIWDFHVALTTPAETGTFYFIFAESGASGFGTDGMAPFLYQPNTANAESPLEITID